MPNSSIFDAALLHAALRSATPVLYAALAAVITQQGNILNIGVEGIMLSCAFTAVAASYLFGNWLVALLLAIIVGLILAAIMGVAHLKLKGDIFVVGMAVNMLALAATRFLLKIILGVNGSFYSEQLVPLPRLNIAAIPADTALDALFNNYSLFELLAVPAVIFTWLSLYRTVWGLRLRSVGQRPLAAITAGINATGVKMQAMLLSGLFAAIAGAHLSLGYSLSFVENMTNGRGFMGVATMFFGGGNPLFATIGCLLFGFCDALAARMQAFGLPPQFILLSPYLITVTILALSMARRKKREQEAKSALNKM